MQLPRGLTDLHGPATGSLGLSASRCRSGPHPHEVRWEVTDFDRRRDLSEIVLVESGLDDITRLVDDPALVEVWERMCLPHRVRSAGHP
jgi:hypothetical protein